MIQDRQALQMNRKTLADQSAAAAVEMTRLTLRQVRWTERTLLRLLAGDADGAPVTGPAVPAQPTAPTGSGSPAGSGSPISPVSPVSPVSPIPPVSPGAATEAAMRRDLAEQLDRLLDRAVSQSSAVSRLELYRSLLSQLVPDEARILAALSDRPHGSASVDIVSRGTVPGAGRRVLENASSVGRDAGVALPQMVPTYLAHLRRLDLVETGPEQSVLTTDYEVLMAEKIVRDALVAAGKESRLPPRVIRGTVRLSPLGRALWAACRGGAGSGELVG